MMEADAMVGQILLLASLLGTLGAVVGCLGLVAIPIGIWLIHKGIIRPR